MTDPAEDVWRPRRGPLPWLSVLAVAVIGGFAVYKFAFTTPISARRVLVAVQTRTADGTVGRWWGTRGRASARITDALSKQLEKLGFEPVIAGDPEVLAELEGGGAAEELRDRARSLGAAWIVGGELTTVETRPVPGREEVAASFTLTLTLVPVAGDDAGSPAGALEEPLTLRVTAADEEAAQLEVSKLAASAGAGALGSALAARPELARFETDPANLSGEELRIASDLGPLFKHGKRRSNLLALRSEAAADGEKAELEAGLSAERRLGPYLAEEYFVGPAAGDRVLLMTIERRVDVPPGATSIRVREGYERLESADPSGGDRKVLLATYNIYSYPGVSADGRTVALVIDHFGWAKALAVLDVETGAVRELASHASHYFSSPRPSPDGERVAFFSRTCRRCAPALEVVGADGEGRKLLYGPLEDESASMPVFSADGKTLYLTIEPRMEPASLWAIDVTSGEKTPLLGPAFVVDPAELVKEDADADDSGVAETADDPAEPVEDEPLAVDPALSGFDSPAITPDGKTIALVERAPNGRYHVGLFDVATRTYKRFQPGWATSLVFSPDGRWLAAETRDTRGPDDPVGWDREVVVANMETGDTTILTHDGTHDDVMGWSRDSKRVYFQQGSRDPDGKSWNSRVYWAAP